MFEVQSRSAGFQEWSPHGICGWPNEFSTEAEAEETIEALEAMEGWRELGENEAEAEFRVREIMETIETHQREIQYDYENQAWILNGLYQACAHPASMNCRCYGKLHAGEQAPLREGG